MEMTKPGKNITYLNNPNLKAAGVEIGFEDWQIEEMAKCYNDPIYFIENYVKIVNVDEGLVLFKLYDYQKRMVKTTLDNRHVIALYPRQSGKCVCYKTLLNIRSKKTCETYQISIGDFYEWQKFRKHARPILDEHSVQTTNSQTS